MVAIVAVTSSFLSSLILSATSSIFLGVVARLMLLQRGGWHGKLSIEVVESWTPFCGHNGVAAHFHSHHGARI